MPGGAGGVRRQKFTPVPITGACHDADTSDMATPDDQIQDLIDGLLDRSRVQLRADLEGLLRNVADASATQQEEAARTARTTAEAAAASLVAEAISAERATAAEKLQAAVDEAEQAANTIHQAALTALQSDLKAAQTELADAKAQAARDLADARSTVVAASTAILDGVKAIDDAQSLTEVLDGFLDHASRHTPRVAMLLLTDEKLRGWKWLGFLGPATTVEFALTDSHLVSQAARAGKTETSSAAGTPDAVLAPTRDGHTSVAIPIVIDGRVVAVLYGDDDGEESTTLPGAWPQLLEVLARHASRALEAMTARRMPDLVRASAAERAKRSDAEARPALLGQAS